MKLKIWFGIILPVILIVSLVILTTFNIGLSSDLIFVKNIKYSEINITKSSYALLSYYEGAEYEKEIPIILSATSSLSNREYTKYLYNYILNREPDAQGWNYWTDIIDRGASRESIISGFYTSAEYFSSSKTKNDSNVIAANESVEYLTGAQAIIGNITLINSGIVTAKYNFKNIRGCIELKDSADKDSPVKDKNQFSINYLIDGKTLFGGETIEVKPKEKIVLNLKGIYYPGRIEMKYFTKTQISRVSIYVLDSKDEDLFKEKYSSKRYESNDCNYLKENAEKTETILFS